jgi:hypothetical protein
MEAAHPGMQNLGPKQKASNRSPPTQVLIVRYFGSGDLVLSSLICLPLGSYRWELAGAASEFRSNCENLEEVLTRRVCDKR